MKHLKTYKIFESITEKQISDVAYDVRTILQPLLDKYIKVRIHDQFVTNPSFQHFIEIKISNFDSAKEFIDEIKQLISYMSSEDWSLLDKHEHSGSNVVSNKPRYRCPNCYEPKELGSDITYNDPLYDKDFDYINCDSPKCTWTSPISNFKTYVYHFKTAEELEELVKNDDEISTINIKFTYNEE